MISKINNLGASSPSLEGGKFLRTPVNATVNAQQALV
jgi:hypothetical protein